MTTANPNETSGSRAGLAFLPVLFLLGAGIVAAGIFSYRHYERQFSAEVEQRLSAVADLKMIELAQWRTERLGDGSLFFQNASFAALVRCFLEKPDDANAQRQIQTWLERCQTLNRYDQIRLLDVRGVTRMAVPASHRVELASVISQAIPELLRSGRVTFQDFYRNDHDQRVYLTVLVPILDEADSRQPLGALILRIDPETYLYPFIRSWPTPSRTAETLLVRRDGNEALFLNELKFQTKTALKLRIPLVETNTAAVKAALGQEGVVECRDYRGVPVVAALRAIPDSPWLLVARMDTAEVYAPLRERLWLTVLLMGALLLAASASVGMAWHQQRVRHYRLRHEATEALLASEIRYRRLFESAKDGILILDAETGMVVDVNPFLIELLGFSHEQFLGKKLWELGFFKDIVANQAHFVELQQKEYIRYEDRALQTTDGRRIEVEFVSNVYSVNHHKVIQCNIRDITERKRSEEAFQREQVFTASLLESLPGIFYLYTYPELRLVRWNKQHESSLGYESREMIGHHVTDWHVPETREVVLNAVAEVMDKGRGSVEAALVAKGGQLVPFFLTGVKFEAQGQLYLMGIGIDITERKQAEAARRESETRYSSLFENMLNGLAYCRMLFDGDRPQDIIYLAVNQAFETQTGLKDVVGKKASEVIPGIRETDPLLFELYGRVARTGVPERIETYVEALKMWFAIAVYSPGKDHFTTVFDVITERKQAQAALQESEERFRTMANSMSQLAWIAKADGFIFWYNERWYDYTGTTPEQMEGWGWQSVHDPKVLPHVMENWKSAIAAGRPFEMEFPLRGADGRFRSFLTRGQPLKNSEGRVVQWFGTNTDVDELKQAEEKVRLLNAELEQRVLDRTAELHAANKELEAFSYSVSHDLRAPLRHVLGYVEMLVQEAGDQLSENGRRYLKVITDASTEMGELIDDLLAFSRMGRVEMRETSVALDALVRKTLCGLATTTAGRNIAWKVPPLPVVQGDPALLKQVFANLLGNAVKYTRPRDPAEIQLGCAGEEDGRIVLFVRDNGVGFDPQYAHKLYGVFQRLHRADEFEGTGIGLAHVRRIIARHGGRTWAESKVNEGATFYFTLKPSSDPVK